MSRESFDMDKPSKPRAGALVPFGVFAIFYVGLSVWANDFYRVPMIIAFLVASAVALCLNVRKPLEEKVESRRMRGAWASRTS